LVVPSCLLWYLDASVFNILLRLITIYPRSRGEMDEISLGTQLLLGEMEKSLSLSLIFFLDSFPIGVDNSTEVSSLAGVYVFRL
jgi:hypothetical protein